MKKIYVDTSNIGEVKRKKLDDNITIGYDENDNIVGIEINNPIGLDIDDEEFEPDTYDEVVITEKAKLFNMTLENNEDYIFDASGGEMRDATPEMKNAMFNVLCNLTEIYYIQDQLEMPN